VAIAEMKIKERPSGEGELEKGTVPQSVLEIVCEFASAENELRKDMWTDVPGRIGGGNARLRGGNRILI